jgi:hypothetical protein
MIKQTGQLSEEPTSHSIELTVESRGLQIRSLDTFARYSFGLMHS